MTFDSGPRRLLVFLFATVFLITCADDDPTPGPKIAVQIEGVFSLAEGETLTLRATTSGAADSAYSWSTSDETIATIDDAGVVTGVSVGEVIITATGDSSGASGQHPIVVVAAPMSQTPYVRVSGNPFLLIGGTVTLTAETINGEDAGYAWTSSDDTIATVDGNGVVTGKIVGEVTVTATGADTDMSDDLLVAVVQQSPHYDDWLASAHADSSAEAFNYWNDADPVEIPASCAKCHSTPGFLDFIGEDGSTPDQVDAAAPVGTVIHCGACHNETAEDLDFVTFPSGEVIADLGPEAKCMTCHQGRASTDSVNDLIATAAVATDDEPSAQLAFQNIHYYAAGATLNAGRVRGGYQYAGQIYDTRFRHVPERDTCIGCHDPHSLEVRFDACQSCHAGLVEHEDLKDIRMMASLGQDYDGDGNLTEGIYYEMAGLQDKLLTAIKTYATDMSLGAICYGDAYPYWFKDTNADGACDAAEQSFGNKYEPFTARLLRATYNYQVSLKDPGAFAHNAKYIIQILYDSVNDVNATLNSPVDLSATVRNDVGHFNGASDAARHWDEDEEVSQSCSRCHSGSEGFRFYLEYGVGTTVVEPDNGMDCATCHDNFGTTYDVVPVDDVTFPSDVTISDPGNVSNVCMTCHQGRVSKKDIDDAIAASNFRFLNVHYLPAGAVKKGTLAKVGYEYTAKTYSGEWVFHGQCVNCHDALATNHSFHPSDNTLCTNGCHAPTPVDDIRTSNHPDDYDNDGSATEALGDELADIAAAVLSEMQTVSDAAGSQLCYDPDSYPYFFNDVDMSGACDNGEASYPNRFTEWTAQLMKAAHNYQIFQKDPGAWAHNFDYVAQLLIDSFEDLGGNVAAAGYIRPSP